MDMYEATVPVLVRRLEQLSHILKKGQTWATENGKSDEEMLQAKLALDMFPLVRQVQIASDNAKSIAARLAGTEPPKMEDNETTLGALIDRVDRTVAFLKTLKASDFEGAETRQIPFPYVPDTYLLGQEALLESYLPNFYFHVTTAYAILRHLGVPLGKADFIGDLPLKPVTA